MENVNASCLGGPNEIALHGLWRSASYEPEAFHVINQQVEKTSTVINLHTPEASYFPRLLSSQAIIYYAVLS